MALQNAQLCAWLCQPNKAEDVSLWLLLYQLITLGKLWLSPVCCEHEGCNLIFLLWSVMANPGHVPMGRAGDVRNLAHLICELPNVSQAWTRSQEGPSEQRGVSTSTCILHSHPSWPKQTWNICAKSLRLHQDKTPNVSGCRELMTLI